MIPWPPGPFPVPLSRVNRGPGSLDEQNTSTKVLTGYQEKGGPRGPRRPYSPNPALQPATRREGTPSLLLHASNSLQMSRSWRADRQPRVLSLWFFDKSQTPCSEMTTSKYRTHSPALSPKPPLEHLSDSGPVTETTQSNVSWMLGC